MARGLALRAALALLAARPGASAAPAARDARFLQRQLAPGDSTAPQPAAGLGQEGENLTAAAAPPAAGGNGTAANGTASEAAAGAPSHAEAVSASAWSAGSFLDVPATQQLVMQLEADLTPLNLLVTGVLWLALLGLVAAYYDKVKVIPRDLPKDGQEHTIEGVFGSWRYGPFSCFGDPTICLFTMFCSTIRWADTMRMSGFMTFWGALGIGAGLLFLNLVTLMAAFGLTLVIVQIYYRQKLRELFGMDRNNCGAIVEDFLMYCFCPLCAICQEARHIEEAHSVGHPAVRPLQ